MARFVYKLQNVLDIKLKLEEQAKSNYAMATQQVNQEEATLKAIEDEKSSFIEECRRKSIGNLNITELKHMNEGIAHFEALIKRQKSVLENAIKLQEIARFRLNEAIKDRKMHQQLKEKAFEEFKLEVNEEEKKEIDQLVSFKYNNRKG